jgi:hypothetical protein
MLKLGGAEVVAGVIDQHERAAVERCKARKLAPELRPRTGNDNRRLGV